MFSFQGFLGTTSLVKELPVQKELTLPLLRSVSWLVVGELHELQELK